MSYLLTYPSTGFPKNDPKTQPKTEERKPLEKQYEIPEKEKVQEQSGEKFDSDSKQRQHELHHKFIYMNMASHLPSSTD